jgi:hypothetical protein
MSIPLVCPFFESPCCCSVVVHKVILIVLRKIGGKKVDALMIVCSIAYDWYERGEGSAGWSAQPQHPAHQVTGQTTVFSPFFQGVQYQRIRLF